MHAFVFWGFVAFAGYTTVEFLYGLGIADLTRTSWFHAYRLVLMPFAAAVLAGIGFLLVRRAIVRPVALGPGVSLESVAIALFIILAIVCGLFALIIAVCFPLSLLATRDDPDALDRRLVAAMIRIHE